MDSRGTQETVLYRRREHFAMVIICTTVSWAAMAVHNCRIERRRGSDRQLDGDARNGQGVSRYGPPRRTWKACDECLNGRPHLGASWGAFFTGLGPGGSTTHYFAVLADWGARGGHLWVNLSRACDSSATKIRCHRHLPWRTGVTKRFLPLLPCISTLLSSHSTSPALS